MKRTSVPTMADLRGFRYGLEPYVKTQEWQLDKLQAALGIARKAHDEALQQLHTLESELDTQAQALGRNFQERRDPVAHRRGLEFLSVLQQRIARQRTQVQKLRQELVDAQRACSLQQRKLEGLHEHRAQSATEFAADLSRRDAAELDRDWLGRSALLSSREGS